MNVLLLALSWCVSYVQCQVLPRVLTLSQEGVTYRSEAKLFKIDINESQEIPEELHWRHRCPAKTSLQSCHPLRRSSTCRFCFWKHVWLQAIWWLAIHLQIVCKRSFSCSAGSGKLRVLLGGHTSPWYRELFIAWHSARKILVRWGLSWQAPDVTVGSLKAYG